MTKFALALCTCMLSCRPNHAVMDYDEQLQCIQACDTISILGCTQTSPFDTGKFCGDHNDCGFEERCNASDRCESGCVHICITSHYRKPFSDPSCIATSDNCDELEICTNENSATFYQ